MEMIALNRLIERADNANVMPAELFDKLVGHIKRTGRYPALIVRPHPERAGYYELLDGHHRKKALEALEVLQARCEVWDVNDDEALVLLTTLNRLQGMDDVTKRAALVEALSQRVGEAALPVLLPETAERLARLRALAKAPEKPAAAPNLASIPEAVTFFLNAQQRRNLTQRLSAFEGTRSDRFVCLLGLDAMESTADDGSVCTITEKGHP